MTTRSGGHLSGDVEVGPTPAPPGPAPGAQHHAYGIPQGETFVTERFPPLTAWRSDRHPCRVHITAPADVHRPGTSGAGRQAFCGIGAYASRKGPKVAVDIHAPLGEGETWCPRCLGQALVYLIGDGLPVDLIRAALLERGGQ